MNRLDGRVRLLERRRLAAGCPRCNGHPCHIVAPGEGLPPWLNASSCCRACGTGVKLIDREAWELL